MRLLAQIADFFWPLTCLGCQRLGTRLCHACQTALRGKTTISAIGDLRVVAAGNMRVPLLSRSIWELKYKNAKHLAPSLGRLLAAALLETHPLPALLVPVPLHPARLRKRGYNQSELLARQVAQIAAWHYADVLVRQRATKSQVETTSRTDRLENMQHAFTAPQTLSGRNILLVDDVCTTGATLLACRSALLEAGAAKVTALVVARG